MSTVRDAIAEQYPELLFLEPDFFDDAILGVAEQAGGRQAVLYDVAACLAVLRREHGWGEAAALDWFGHNTAAAYVGPATPMFLYPVVEAG